MKLPAQLLDALDGGAGVALCQRTHGLLVHAGREAGGEGFGQHEQVGGGMQLLHGLGHGVEVGGLVAPGDAQGKQGYVEVAHVQLGVYS